MVAVINRGVVELADQEGNSLITVFLVIRSHRNTSTVHIVRDISCVLLSGSALEPGFCAQRSLCHASPR